MFRLAVALTLALSLAARADNPEPPATAKVYRSPQEVFDASVTAQQKKDFKTMVACVAPEAQMDMATGYAFAALNIKEGNRGAIRKALKPLFDVLDRHGLTEKATRDIPLGDDPKTEQKARAALGKLIKKPAAFAEEYLAAQDKIGAGERPGETKVRLADLKVKGDRAAGTMVIDFGGSLPTRNPVEFVKIKGSWKMIPEPRPAKAGKDK